MIWRTIVNPLMWANAALLGLLVWLLCSCAHQPVDYCAKAQKVRAAAEFTIKTIDRICSANF